MCYQRDNEKRICNVLQKATGGFLKDVIFVAFEDNYLLKDELPGNLANPSVSTFNCKR